jgi:hypothetical protein
MTLLLSCLAFFVGLPMALFFAYAIGVQYERERWPDWLPLLRGRRLPMWLRAVCACVAAFGLVIDVLANWTVLAIYLWEWPKRRPSVMHTEWTFSTRLERLVLTYGWRWCISWRIARMLNWIAPPGKPHIHNAVLAAIT